jgi:hypothetical protein
MLLMMQDSRRIIEAVAEARAQFAAFLNVSRRLRRLSVARWWPQDILLPFVSVSAAGNDPERLENNVADSFCWPPGMVALDCTETAVVSWDLVSLAQACGTSLHELAFNITKVDYGIVGGMRRHTMHAHGINHLLNSLTRYVHLILFAVQIYIRHLI